ncbi:hypothetical protein MNBD_ALPHA11-2268 [hydrothermal vent metagenome]|uniref:Uncharacterized protein n=1 Tax=hydrothermal vent metagenome TaxID=652676 RepID=A0A3B0U2A4_9ZZZZ
MQFYLSQKNNIWNFFNDPPIVPDRFVFSYHGHDDGALCLCSYCRLGRSPRLTIQKLALYFSIIKR